MIKLIIAIILFVVAIGMLFCGFSQAHEGEEYEESGGSLGYFYQMLSDHSGDFDDKELDHLVLDLAELFYAREWYLSGDTGKEDWNKARNDFKEKWLTSNGQKERIEQYLAEFTMEIREAFGINHNHAEESEDE